MVFTVISFDYFTVSINTTLSELQVAIFGLYFISSSMVFDSLMLSLLQLPERLVYFLLAFHYNTST